MTTAIYSGGGRSATSTPVRSVPVVSPPLQILEPPTITPSTTPVYSGGGRSATSTPVTPVVEVPIARTVQPTAASPQQVNTTPVVPSSGTVAPQSGTVMVVERGLSTVGDKVESFLPSTVATKLPSWGWALVAIGIVLWLIRRKP